MIAFKDITIRFEDKTILSNYNLQIKDHSVVCIMGDSGIGKSTILKALLGLVTPQSGTIDGILDKRFSVVFQEDRLCENLSAIKNVMMVLEGKYKKDIAKEHLLHLLKEEDLFTKTQNLSGGMKRRVAIARAMAHISDIILMDEPFTGLDETTKKKVIDYIQKYRNNRTLILITHDKKEAELLYTEEVIYLNH